MTTTPSLVSRTAPLDASLAFVAALVARGGPEASEYHQLDALMHLLPSLTRAELEQVRGAFGSALTDTEAMQAFAYVKPHGYAGDFEVIDRIYLERVAERPELARWDRYFHAQPAARAVRNRKSYFHTLLDRHAARCRTGLRVLNLASGPGRCMAEWLDANPDARVSFTCVELDPTAIAHARELTSDHAEKVTFAQHNVLRFEPRESYDLIWAAGICDYFSDAIFARLVRRFLPVLAPGGELVAGNFSPDNPTRAYMEVLGEWRLQHRTADELRRIALVAGVEPDAIHIGAEAEGVNLFLHLAAPTR